MIVYSTLCKGQKPTEEQIREIEEAKKHPIVYDEDCPPLSDEMIEKIRRKYAWRRNQKKGS
ncbi:MAG: hypothetical protein IKI01_07450 [Lachnospiraceae bacterium]|nr:hypothetical protein [Lachnospiraceae bacterium]